MRKACSFGLVIAVVGWALVVPAAATQRQSLTIPEFFDIVPHEEANRLYLTAGHPHDVLLVTDLTGTEVTTLNGLPGASGLALSGDGASLWVALPGAEAIARIDTTTLIEAERISLPSGTCPGSVAVVGGHLAVGHSCNQYAGSGSYGGVGILDPASGGWNPVVSPVPYYQPYVASAPGADGLFVAGDLGLSPTRLYTIGIVDGVGDTVSSNSNTGSNLRDLAMSPDGGLVAQAAGYPYQHDVLNVVGLNTAFTFNTTNYPNAVAWSADGMIVATGTDSPYDDDVRVHLRDQPDPFVSFELGERLQPRGLAINADGSLVFAVGGSVGDLGLHVLSSGPIAIGSAITLQTSSIATIGDPLTIDGTLTFDDGSNASGRTIEMSLSYADVVQDLPDTVTGPGGSFSITDLPVIATDITYSATFSGAGSYEASTASTSVEVQKRATELSIATAQADGKRGRNKLVVTAHLGPTYSSRVVTITARDNRGERIIANGAVDSAGNLSVEYRLRRTTTFIANFAGDEWYLPATASVVSSK